MMTKSGPPDDPEVPLYRRLAARWARLIEGGVFPPGARLPSLRSFGRQMSVSLTTAMEVFRVLEDQGLVEVRPQSGHYVRYRRPLPPAPGRTTGGREPVLISPGDMVMRIFHDAGDASFAPFGAAVPPPEFLPVERLNRILAREVRLRPERTQSYDSIRGFAELRAQIARRMLEAGCAVDPDEVITTNGARHALYLSLQAVTKPGDTVLLETPTYTGFLQILEALRLRALEIATDPRDGICLEALEDALARRPAAACVLVPTFGNPLGHCMPDARRAALAKILMAARVPLIEDDVYGELYFGGTRPRAVKAFDRDGSVLFCSSFSKTIAPGYRVGWVVPGRYVQEVERQKYVTSVATPAPTQMAIAVYLADGGYDRHLRRLRETYQALQARFVAAVTEYFPEGTKMTRPRGGHIVWLELPPGLDSFALYQLARRHRISLAPGPIYSASGGYRNCIRLNYAVRWSDAIDRALRILGGLAGQASRKSRKSGKPASSDRPPIATRPM
jgi:DNA-binding transcriptional MocR family regulator